MDIFPTFLRAAGGDPAAYTVDGQDILPLLRGEAAMSDREIYWEMDEQTALRQGPWKLVLDGRLVEGAPAQDRVHLANLDEDMGERENLATRLPELTAALQAKAHTWRARSKRVGSKNGCHR